MKPGMLLAAVIAAVISLPAAAGDVSFSKALVAVGSTTESVNTVYVPLAAQSITQSTDTTTITPLNSVACNAAGLHDDNSYYRRFDLDGVHNLTNPLDVTSVDVGIETATGAGGSQPVEVRLYSIANADQLSLANLTQVGSAVFDFADAATTVANFPVTGVVNPATDDLVVEVFTPEGQTAGNSFFIGSNSAGQSAPGYIAAAGCGIPEPTDTATLGFPNMHIVMVVNGAVGAISIDDVSQAEGDGGTTDFTFTITRDRNHVDMSVDWVAVDGVAKNKSGLTPFDDDYDTLGGTVSFVAGGAFSQSITIPVTGDTRYETDEDFSVQLSNPVNAIIADDRGLGAILNDDTAIACDLPSNPLLNCSFETGDFTGWLPKDIDGGIPMQVSTSAPVGSFVTHPTDGIYSVTNGFDGAGPDTYELAQDVSIPAGATMLEFDYRLGWGNSGADRTLSVNIEPPSGGVPLQSTLVMPTAGIVNMSDTGILRGEVDVSAFAGQPVRINFVWTIPETFTGPGSAELDNVLIRVPPGVRVSPISGLATTEGGGSTSFDVVLDTAPSGVVTLDFVSSDPGEGTVSTTTVDFTAANWDVQQTINVTGVNDDVMDGDQPYTIAGSITGGSPEYPTSMPVDDISVVNLDNNAQLTIRKVATGGDTTFKFSSTTTPMLDSASITTSGGSGQQEFFTGLLEGTHNLTEDAKTGWIQGLASCDKGKILPDIQLDAGDNVTCTFENTEMGSIKVFKETVGGFGTFEFASKALGPFEIAIKAETGNKGAATFNRLLPGTYDIAEIVPDGWSLRNQFCDDGSILPDIDVSPGESVTCTFINTRHDPGLSLTKSAVPASFALLGDNIRYLFEAKNEGNVDLTDVTVTDPLSGLGTIDCDGSGGPTAATLAVAGSVSCEAMYSITQVDLDKGFVTNKASVVAKDPSLKDVTADSNEVTISKLTSVCFDGELTIPDGMVFAGDGTTMYASTVSIDTWAPAANGVIVEAPHELILNAPEVQINELFSVEADADLENPPGGGQLRVIIGPVNCNAPPGVVE